MIKKDKLQTLTFCCNCFILYVLVGFFSAIMADTHQSFQSSYQSENASKFSRLISLQMAYTAKENLLK